MRVSSSYFLWVMPFLSFLFGYQLLSWFSHKEIMQTPLVLGLPLQDAIKVLSAYQLNVRILKEKEDADIPEGIVISQSPEQGHKIKSYQSVFLVITRKPPYKKTPAFYTKKLEKILCLAQEASIPIKTYMIESAYPEGQCFAQLPLPQEPAIDSTLVAYISNGSTSLRIFPSFKDQELTKVEHFLKEYNMQFHVFHQGSILKEHSCSSCVVVDQRPLAGSLVDLKKSLAVQLTVAPKI